MATQWRYNRCTALRHVGMGVIVISATGAIRGTGDDMPRNYFRQKDDAALNMETDQQRQTSQAAVYSYQPYLPPPHR